MRNDDLTYYAEITVLVDGWPWNLSEIDFRSWFAPGRCPVTLATREIVEETSNVAIPVTASENRRAKSSRKQKKQQKRVARQHKRAA